MIDNDKIKRVIKHIDVIKEKIQELKIIEQQLITMNVIVSFEKILAQLNLELDDLRVSLAIIRGE